MMKKVLVCAIGAILLETVVYFVALLLGMPHDTAVIVATIATITAVFALALAIAVFATTAFDFAVAATAVFATVTVAVLFAEIIATKNIIFFDFFDWAGLAVTVFVAVVAALPGSFIAARSGVQYGHAFAVYCTVAVAILGTLSLSAWWPAVAGIAILGGWYAVERRRERHKMFATM